MCFPAASSSICKYSGIEAVQYGVEQVLGGRLVHISLCDVLVKDSVESERLILDTFALGHDRSGEALDIVLWRVEDAFQEVSNGLVFLLGGLISQAFFIHHLNDWSNTLLLHVRRWSSREGTVPKEHWAFIGAGQLCGLADGERAHADGDLMLDAPSVPAAAMFVDEGSPWSSQLGEEQ